MISATYFGEITELDSRAVWYSDEEDDEDVEDGELAGSSTSPKLGSIEPISHETFRANIQLNFKKVVSNLEMTFSTCVISLSSSWQYKHYKLSDSNNLPYLGCFDSVGKAFAFPAESQDKDRREYLLWLLFDKGHQYICGQEVGYFVEALREKLHTEFRFTQDCKILILSQQFSDGDQLEYLSNFKSLTKTDVAKLPFVGSLPISPPVLIKNHFESSLFEQLTISLKLAIVVCLPNPKNFWFDKTRLWPSVPDNIIIHKLNDDNLEKTLIFT